MKQEKLIAEAAAYYAATHLQVEAISYRTRSLTECRPHICHFCDKGFASNFKLVEHIRVHTGEKPFHCSYCPRSFTTCGNLNQHEKFHRGERDYKCPFCPKTYILNPQLMAHIRVHSGLKLYSCPDCPEKYYSSTDLKRHRIGKHGMEGQLPCSENNCDKKFTSKGDLNKHLKVIHGILLPYECLKCDQRFRLQNELLCHEPSHEDAAAEKQSTSIQSSSLLLQKPVKKSVPAPAKIQKSTKDGKSHEISAESHESKKEKSKETELKKKVEKQLLEKKSKIVKAPPKSQVSNKSIKVNRSQKQDDDEIIVIYQGNKKEELSKESSVNSDMKKIKKKKAVSQDVENEPPQNKDHQINENFQNSKTKKNNEKQKVINIEKQSNQMIGDKNTNKEPIRLKRKRKPKKCEFIFRERIDGLQNLYAEQIIVIDDETPQEETVKECSENNKIDNKKRKGKRKVSENVENEVPSNTEIQLIDISSENSDHSKTKRKKNDKDEIIDIENQNIIIIDIEDDDNENEEAFTLMEKQKINNFELLVCSCGKYFSSSSKFKRHRLKRGHRRPKIHECPFCVDKSFKTIRAFEFHFNDVHCDNSEEEEEEEDSVYDSDEDGPLIHECFLCLPQFRAFPDIEALDRHFNKTHNSM